jgi:signal transduction histidine kinase/CheY-like chemotaxis protein
MPPATRSLAARYGFAALAAAVALLARLALDPWLGDALPLLAACLAVVAVAWYGGFGPSLLTLGLGTVATAYCFLPPRYDLAASLPGHRVLLGGFLFLGLTIGLFSERLRVARRRAEDLARAAVRRRQELEEEVARRQRLEHELQRRAEELALADRRKDEFLAILGHELRNPLAPIRNAVHLLQVLGTPDPTLQQARAMIERQVGHLCRLVDDLLDVSRITRGKVGLRKEPADLATALHRAVESTRPLIDANRHTLALTLLPQPTRVVADVTRLEQVFANLLNNAAKYTERGGSITVVEERQGDEVLIRVRDTGFGIAAPVLPHVFDLFTQADGTLDRSQGGLGIGLTLVKTLVELHGGRVTAHSDGPGKGSEFIVRLPISKDERGRRKDETSKGPVHPSSFLLHPSRKVLVVEDDRDAADSLALVLRHWGHDVRTSHDGLSGLKAARSYRPEVVLLDIGLPGLDGYAVARQLRGELGQDVRLVAVTGYGQEEDRRRAVEASFDAHLVKPADLAALQAVLAGFSPAANIPT